jgi:hypothetical protein
MHMLTRRIAFAVPIAATVALLALAGKPAAGQAPVPRPRTADGKPNLNGIWQAMNTANWDLQPHEARQGSVLQMGAVGAVPAGAGVVEGGSIPYKPDALVKKKANGNNWLNLDPEVKCYLPGVPRATYLPHPFQIVQTPTTVLIAYEFASTSRVIYLDRPRTAPVDTWMGTSNGRWEGDTLVVDVTGMNDKTWFDRAGDFHSDALHVVERYSLASPEVLNYEATIEDPKVFTRSWKISMPLYRHAEKNAQLLEFKCAEFVEELLYGQFRKPAGSRSGGAR